MIQSNLKDVLDKIQCLRKDLDSIVQIKGTRDSGALELSQRLDKVLNEYYSLLKTLSNH